MRCTVVLSTTRPWIIRLWGKKSLKSAREIQLQVTSHNMTRIVSTGDFFAYLPNRGGRKAFLSWENCSLRIFFLMSYRIIYLSFIMWTISNWIHRSIMGFATITCRNHQKTRCTVNCKTKLRYLTLSFSRCQKVMTKSRTTSNLINYNKHQNFGDVLLFDI